MIAESLYTKIVNELRAQPTELPTVPSNKTTPKWFRAYIEDGDIYVESAKVNRPSSNMSMRRIISAKDFVKVYSYYDEWANGNTKAKQEAVSESLNSAYIFALIAKYREGAQ